MKYDFTSIMDRHGKDSIAVDCQDNPAFRKFELKEGFDIIPMWVADMNFPTVPTIPQAIIERASHPAYGYFRPTDAYYNGIIEWQKDRHGVEGIKPENIGYENGVLGGVATVLSVLCSKGDKVLVQKPTYVGFTGVLTNNGYNIIHSGMYKDENNIWRIDYEDMEKKIVEEHIHTAIFCSPHNPTGRVWEREEIEKYMDICRRHDVYVISDEIWSDLIMPGYKHIPTQSISEDAKMRTVAMYAPSKTFNLAGLIGSYHIVYNQWLNDRMLKESSLGHYNSMNVLSMHALIGAYTKEGREWVDELCEVLNGNIEFAVNYINEHFKGVKVARPQGTYMLYLDCSEWCRDHGKTIDDLLDTAYSYGVIYQDGRRFLIPDTIRMNLALPLSRVQEAFARLDRYVFNAE